MKWVLRAAVANALWMTGAVVAWPGAAMAQAVPAQAAFAIPAGDLNTALRQFMAQTHVQLIYASALTDGKKTDGLSGRYAPAQALARLLQGTGLVAKRVNDRTLLLKQGAPPKGASNATQDKATSSGGSANATPTDLTTVTVTGTRIRGGTTASPTITIGEEQFKQEGFTDLGEVIRSVTQNYSGGQNPGVANGATLGSDSNRNVTGGSSFNLRGLGPDDTLTLLNGRRLVYDGFAQAVDISAIPIEAVDRIEIVPDGASAIYGSDAVGGVVNVILKPDFEGVTLGTRYGDSADGGGMEHQYMATAGTTWQSGGLIATWNKSDSDPIFATQRNYTKGMYDPTTIYPGIDTRNALLSIHQSLGDVAELRLDALDNRRDQQTYVAGPDVYIFSPTKTSMSMVSPSIEFWLPHDWSLTVGATHGKDESNYRAFRVSSGVSTLSSAWCYCNRSRSYEIGTEGPVFALEGGDARLAAGVGARTDSLLIHYTSAGVNYGGDEHARYAYAELSLPFISPDSNIRGIQRLEFDVAGRVEDYDSFGHIATPKLGLIYDPSPDYTLKVSWGKSFKAPTLLQQYSVKYSDLYPVSTFGGSGYPADATAIVTDGGNTNLRPERARTIAPSIAFHPASLPALKAELTYFDIHYTDRVAVPIGSITQALSNPAYAQFISYSPTAQEQAALLAEYSIFTNYTGTSYDPDKVVAIINDQLINVAIQRIKGFDLSGTYYFDLGKGRLTIRGSASRLDSTQQATAGQQAMQMAGDIFYPAKYKSRIGAVWAWNGFSVSGFINYSSGVTNTLTTPPEKTASFTTADVALRYDTGKRSDMLSGLAFELSVQNLFNREPPLYTTISNYYPPYDSTNYSAIGRYVTASISKHW